MKVVLLEAGVSLAALLGNAATEAANNASKLCAAVHACGGKSLHPSYLWPAREALTAQWWLGPLRPSRVRRGPVKLQTKLDSRLATKAALVSTLLNRAARAAYLKDCQAKPPPGGLLKK